MSQPMTEQQFRRHIRQLADEARLTVANDLVCVAQGAYSGCVDPLCTQQPVRVPGAMLMWFFENCRELQAALKQAPAGMKIFLHMDCGYLFAERGLKTHLDQMRAMTEFLVWLSMTFPGKFTVVIEPHGSAQPYMN